MLIQETLVLDTSYQILSGHSSEEHVRWPQRVVGLNGQKVVAISCGSLFSVCVTDDHQVRFNVLCFCVFCVLKSPKTA